jgi:FkbM family methyltransferase
MTIKFRDKTVQVQPINENEHIQKNWKLGNFYEQDMLTYILDNYKDKLNYVDVGGCVGNHTLFFACVMNANSVTTFEPVKELFQAIENNVLLNNCENVTVENVALSNMKRIEKMELSDFKVNAGMSKISNNGTVNIQAIKLDSIKFESIDVMKIDIEGFNKKMLVGATKTIQTHKPDIFIEAATDFEDVNDFLSELGYIYSGKVFCKTPTYLFTPVK